MSRTGFGLVAAVLAFVISGCSGLATGADPVTPPPQKGKVAVATPKPKPTPTPTPAPAKLEELLGDDGRLSVLILGSDARAGLAGARTDAIIVASIDPTTGNVAMASMPRDTVNVPIAPGKVYGGRINALYGEFLRSTGKERKALKMTRQAFEYAFDTEIDYYAMVEFTGLVRLINGIGGVEVTLDKPLIDPTMHIGKKGLRLKAGTRSLDGKTALAFSRSRHSDSDYFRAGRQQQVIAAAAVKVRDRGISALPALIELAQSKLVTDFPLSAAPALFELADIAKLNKPKSVVLAPGRWARPAAQLYTIAPRVVEVRKMFDRVFRPLP